jgi:cytochrome c peroxidase
MLAGRVRANGPFGWHAESPGLAERLTLGTTLHRASWESSTEAAGEQLSRLDYLMDYLRSGLLPPPTLVRTLDATELRGKAIFESDEALCSRCHVPASEFTDRSALPLPALPVRPGFDAERNPAFKTPSLWFIGGTAPYFHDGSQASLEDLVRTNRDRMGKTSHLGTDEQAALIAFLRTL